LDQVSSTDDDAGGNEDLAVIEEETSEDSSTDSNDESNNKPDVDDDATSETDQPGSDDDTTGDGDAGGDGDGDGDGAGAGDGDNTGDGDVTVDGCEAETPRPTSFSKLDRLDSFKFNEPFFNQGEGVAEDADGFWTVSAAGSTFLPLKPNGVNDWADDQGYEERSCDGAGKRALHASATSGEWMSIDAKLLDSNDSGIDFSSYDGVAFWVKSSNNCKLYMSFIDDSTGQQFEIGTIDSEWEFKTISFADEDSEFDPSDARVITFVPKNSGTDGIDLWIDDVYLYKD
jgi:hypothetical protein